jgi:hypothetical protein
MARAALAVLSAAVALLCVAPARSEQTREGNLIASFDAGLHPAALPRRTPAPVAVRVAGDIRLANEDSGQLPQLRRITVAINRQGRLSDRGLPVCNVRMIQPATQAGARQVCGNAIVGSGHVTLQVRIPGQAPFLLRTKMLVFNGPRRGGHKLILAQAYARKPPGAFVLTFRVGRRRGLFGTVMSTTLPASARAWAFITHFDMTLHRVYAFRGRERSFISAACGAPAGFDTILFPFARATYHLATGESLTTAVARTCRVQRRHSLTILPMFQ